MPSNVIDMVYNGIANGILLSPPFIRRETSGTPFSSLLTRYLSTDVFTLQWHITQACDLHCKHCYDRSDRHGPELDQAVKILDDLRSFTKAMNVSGAVSFTGGNPFLHPDFPANMMTRSPRSTPRAIN
jgi:uncharacterized radical SAM superfamily Fe-S cluster-containing enzyme